MVEAEEDGVAETAAEAAKEVVEDGIASLFFVSKSWEGILYCCNFLLILVEDLTE